MAQDIPVPDHSYDGIVSTFGMKTLSDEDLMDLAFELHRVIITPASKKVTSGGVLDLWMLEE